MTSAPWNPHDPVGTIKTWLQEGIEYADGEAARMRAAQEANLAKYRARCTCAIGHPFLVYIGPTNPNRPPSFSYQRCSYCDFARDGFDADHMAAQR